MVQDLVACEVSELAAGKEFVPHLTTNRWLRDYEEAA